MSQWDFGDGREPTEHHEPRYPQHPPYSYPQQDEPEYPFSQQATSQAPPYPEGTGGAAYVPDNAGWSGDAGGSRDAGWSGDGDWSDMAGRSDVAGWPGADGYPGTGEAYDSPAAYPITYERDEFEGRASAAGPIPPGASAPGATPPYAPWPDAPDPADRFGTESSAHRWRPAPAAGERSAAEQAWYPGRQQYPDGPAYRGLGRGADPPTQPGGGWPRGGPPPPQAGDWRPASAGPWRGGAGPWREGAGPWPQGDEDEWDDGPASRGRWLIPVALAVAGAAVGAAIVMLALGHSRSPAGPASPSTATGSSAGAA